MSTRRGLGRGLGALIPSTPETEEGPSPSSPVDIAPPTGVPAETDTDTGDDTAEPLTEVTGAHFSELDVDTIVPNARQPREVFDEEEMAELVHSIGEIGLLQPIVVRPTGDAAYELIMGERRWRATKQAGLATIPAIVRETSDADMLRDALLENLHRSELNPLEEAAAYQQLLDDFGCTQDELAQRIGRSRPQISNTLRLMRLTPAVQRRLASGALSAGHARALLGLDDPALMEELAQRIVSEGLAARAVERLVAGGSQPTTTRSPRRSTYDPYVVDLTSRLSNRLETQVRIDVGKRKGRITMEFTNLEDLERLVENIGLDLRSDAAEDHQS